MRKFFVFFILMVSWQLFFAQQGLFSFNFLNLPDTGYCNGANLPGYFIDTSANVSAKFFNNYNPNYDSWYGFAYSTWTNDTTNGYTNQWSCFPGYLLDSTFVLGYNGIDWNTYEVIPSSVVFSAPIQPISLYVANTTYAALTIINGSNYSEPFADGDYFYLTIRGYLNGQVSGSVVHYLADYTAGKRFVQKDWAYVDLTKLGVVDSLTFTLTTSDTGQYGPNTPMYFAIDQLSFELEPVNTGLQQDDFYFSVYPNPTSGIINFPQKVNQLIIFDLAGHKVLVLSNVKQADLSGFSQGIYVLKAYYSGKWHFSKVILQ